LPELAPAFGVRQPDGVHKLVRRVDRAVPGRVSNRRQRPREGPGDPPLENRTQGLIPNPLFGNREKIILPRMRSAEISRKQGTYGLSPAA
jgi:hypothetical protein